MFFTHQQFPSVVRLAQFAIRNSFLILLSLKSREVFYCYEFWRKNFEKTTVRLFWTQI
jgi:hypothetical protein